ncbi:MAG: TonB family protein [Woeseiaceae bacterium]|nr:TonB family protein [Woeseiaceae bacterium]
MRAFNLALLLIAVTASADDTQHVMRYTDDSGDRTPLHTVVPVYPEKARRDRIEGEVQVCYEVDRGGRPYRIAVRHSTHRIFEKPAKLAVRASSYVPLEPGEKRSGIKTCRTFRFELRPETPL